MDFIVVCKHPVRVVTKDHKSVRYFLESLPMVCPKIKVGSQNNDGTYQNITDQHVAFWKSLTSCASEEGIKTVEGKLNSNVQRKRIYNNAGHRQSKQRFYIIFDSCVLNNANENAPLERDFFEIWSRLMKGIPTDFDMCIFGTTGKNNKKPEEAGWKKGSLNLKESRAPFHYIISESGALKLLNNQVSRLSGVDLYTIIDSTQDFNMFHSTCNPFYCLERKKSSEESSSSSSSSNNSSPQNTTSSSSNTSTSIGSVSPKKPVVTTENNKSVLRAAKSDTTHVQQEVIAEKTIEFKSSLNPHVINLLRRPDRMQEFKDRWPFKKYNVKRVEASDGKKEETDITPFVNLFSGNAVRLSSSAKGCAISHYKLWKQCVKQDKIFTIFEDDTFWTKDCIEVWDSCQNTIPKDFDVAYLGVGAMGNSDVARRKIQAMKNPSDPKCIGWKRYGRQLWVTTLAYIVSPAGAKKLLDIVDSKGFPCQVDHFMIDLHKELNIYILEGILCYSPWMYKSDIVH